jgi:hypothetical protein
MNAPERTSHQLCDTTYTAYVCFVSAVPKLIRCIRRTYCHTNQSLCIGSSCERCTRFSSECSTSKEHGGVRGQECVCKLQPAMALHKLQQCTPARRPSSSEQVLDVLSRVVCIPRKLACTASVCGNVDCLCVLVELPATGPSGCLAALLLAEQGFKVSNEAPDPV